MLGKIRQQLHHRAAADSLSTELRGPSHAAAPTDSVQGLVSTPIFPGDGGCMRFGRRIHAAVFAAPHDIRRYGIHSGMPLKTAFRQRSDAGFLPAGYPLFPRTAAKMEGMRKQLSPHMEDVGFNGPRG